MARMLMRPAAAGPLPASLAAVWSSSSSSSSTSRSARQVAVACSSRGKTDLVRSIRAMPIKLVRVSKDSSKAATDYSNEWVTKLQR